MFRILFAGLVLSSFLSEEGLIANINADKTPEYLISEGSIDPIITGESISDEHKRLWKIQNKKYLECGLCGEEPQPFPGD
jgi:hypothetical protein